MPDLEKAGELREMSDDELAARLKEKTEGLFRLKLQSQTERLDAPSELRKCRRVIARIKTIQHGRARASKPVQQAEESQTEA